ASRVAKFGSPSCFTSFSTSGFGFGTGGGSNDFSHAAAFANAAARSAFALNPTAVADDSDTGRPLGCLIVGNGGHPKSAGFLSASLHIATAAASRTWQNRSRPS